MRCWRCGEQVISGTCISCGCHENSRKPALTETGRMLRYVYDKFGAKRTLTEDGLLVRCMGDVLNNEAELRASMKAAMEAGAGQEFYKLLQSNQPLDNSSFDGLFLILRHAGLTDEECSDVLCALRDMAGCGIGLVQDPQPPQPMPPTPQREISKKSLHPSGDASKNVSSKPANAVLAALYNVSMEDSTHGAKSFTFNFSQKSGALFLRNDGIALHFYAKRGGFGKKQNWNPDPDIFIPIQAVDHIITHDSMLSLDFTLALKDGVRFMVTASTYGYNRKDTKTFLSALEAQLQR